MKVFWLTAIPMPAVLNYQNRPYTSGGSWMAALIEELKKRADITLAVGCVCPHASDSNFIKDGVEYFMINQGGHQLFHFADRENKSVYHRRCANIMKSWKPDIVHIHGTERFYGLLSARKLIRIPTIISLQGLLGPSSEWLNNFGKLPLAQLIKMHSFENVIRGIGPFYDFIRMKKRAVLEAQIISGNSYFMGRTLWDESHCLSLNPDAKYFSVNELLRATFFKMKWELKNTKRHSIIFTNARGARSGMEILLQAVRILLKDYPDIRLSLCGKIPSAGFGKLFRYRVKQMGLSSAVSYLGYLTADKMAKALCSSHVFCIPSYIANSPNSLCEAQAVGMPCIASYVGGIPSLIEEGKTGLFFPSGDAAVLASRIRYLFENDDVAVKLGVNACKVAKQRHCSERITRELMDVYRSVLEDS